MYRLTLRGSALCVQGLIVKVKQGCLITPLRLLSTQFLPRDSLDVLGELGRFNWVARISRVSVSHTCCRQEDISGSSPSRGIFYTWRAHSWQTILILIHIFLFLSISSFFLFLFYHSSLPFFGQVNYK